MLELGVSLLNMEINLIPKDNLLVRHRKKPNFKRVMHLESVYLELMELDLSINLYFKNALFSTDS